eukprot:1448762-Prymnesium_polylepis.1
MLEVIDRVRAEHGEISGVCTFFELAVPMATRLAQALGVPANPLSAVNSARDKHDTRRISAAAGLPTPRHASVESGGDLASVAVCCARRALES